MQNMWFVNYKRHLLNNFFDPSAPTFQTSYTVSSGGRFSFHLNEDISEELVRLLFVGKRNHHVEMFLTQTFKFQLLNNITSVHWSLCHNSCCFLLIHACKISVWLCFQLFNLISKLWHTVKALHCNQDHILESMLL